jgi:hypothetical protein
MKAREKFQRRLWWSAFVLAQLVWWWQGFGAWFWRSGWSHAG